MTHLYLGVDAGASKTEVIITKNSGETIGRGMGDGANPHNTPISTVIDNIVKIIGQATAAAGLDNQAQFESVCLGASGLDLPQDVDRFQSLIQPRISARSLFVCNDGLIAFRSGTDAAKGICLLASTGSNCIGISDNSDEFRAGNWGYLLGDQGSGFDIGQQILKAAIKESDGRSPDSGLLPKVLAYFGVDNLTMLASNIYQHSQVVSHIAGLAKIISETEWIEHPTIIAITASAVSQLHQAFMAVATNIKLDAQHQFPVVLAGRLFLAKDRITSPLIKEILSTHPLAKIIIPSVSPVYGAIKIAAAKSLSSVSVADSLES